MGAWEQRAEGLFDWLGATSIHVAVLVLLVLAVQRLLGRYLTPRWRYGLWLLVLARLVTPSLPSLTLGAPDLEIARWTSESPTPATANPFLGSSSPRARPPRKPVERQAHGDDLDDSARPETAGLRESQRVPNPGGPLGSVAEPTRRARPSLSLMAAPSAAPKRPSVKALAVVLWLLVAAGLATRAVFRALRFHRRLAPASVPADPRLHQLLEECRTVMQLRHPVALRETRSVASPAVTGLWQPTLLLPPDVTDRLTESELRHVFLHELAHLRRRDLPLALVVMALESLYWFHPLVRVAIRRLRTAQESARDWEALAVHPSPAPLSYARTLLKLCEGRAPSPAPVGLVSDFTDGGRDLKRRILMITEFRASSRRAALVGVVLFSTLAWAGFTSAAQPHQPDDYARRAGQTLATVAVEHHQDAPAWLAPLEAALESSISMAAEDTPASEVFAYLRQVSGVNLVVNTSWLDDLGDPELNFEVNDMSLGVVLDLVCGQLGTTRHCLAREAIYVGEDGILAEGTELRFYKLAPFYERDIDIDEFDVAVCELVPLFAEGESWTWDVEGAFIETWNGLLVVSQTRKMHEAVEGFLNRLLNRGAQDAPETPSWRTSIEELLASPAEVSLEDMPLTEAAELLSTRYGVPILVSEDYEWEDVDLQLSGVSLRTVLEWLGASQGLTPRIHAGAVELVEGASEMSLEYYELGTLIELAQQVDQDDVRDNLEVLMRDRIEVDTWDTEQAALVFLEDLLLVRNTESAHQQIGNLIHTLERAFRD